MSVIKHVEGKSLYAAAIAVSDLPIGRSALYENHAIYCKATRAGILAGAVNKGMTPAGRWSEVVKAVKARQKGQCIQYVVYQVLMFSVGTRA